MFLVITVTLYGRNIDWTTLWVDSSNSRSTFSTYPKGGIWTASLPSNTRLLAVEAGDNSGDEQPGILIKLSNGFVTGSHWRCTHSTSGDWQALTYDDSAWPQAVIYNWTWGEHDLHPAEFISGEEYGRRDSVYCRGLISKYIKHND